MKKTSKKQDQTLILYEEKKKGFSKLAQEIKTSIFGVLFLLLKDENDDEYDFFISAGFDYFQLHYYPFLMFVMPVWRAPHFFSVLVSICNNNLDMNKFDYLYFFMKFTQVFSKNYLNISFLQLNITWEELLIVFYLFVFLIILITMDIAFVAYCFAQKKFPFVWPLVLLRDVTHYFITVFFLPITSKKKINLLRIFKFFLLES